MRTLFITLLILILIGACVEETVLDPTEPDPAEASGSVLVTSNIADAVVFLNTERIGPVGDGRRIHVEAGTHVITVSAPGYASATERIEIGENEEASIAVPLLALRTNEETGTQALTGRVIDPASTVVNGGFENEQSGWSRTGPVTFDDSEPHEGSISMRADKSHRGAFQTIELTPGRTYELNAAIRTERVRGFGAWVSFVMTGSSDGSARAWSTDVIDATNGWTSVAREFTVPETFEKGQIEIGLELGGGSAWFDSINLVPVTADPEPEPARCGDGVRDDPEECDLGTANGDVCEPGYDATCTYCSDSCSIVNVDGGSCGDGVCQNEESSSSCSADCGPTTYCGDGVISEPNDDGVYEECDAGTLNGVECTPEAGACEYCTESCTIEVLEDTTSTDEPDEPGPIVLEAEQASVSSGFSTTTNSTASEGAYLEASTSGTGSQTASIGIDVSATDTYTIWARLYAPSLNDDAIYVGVDGTLNRVYPSATGTYEWVRIGDYDLSGAHRVSIGPAEAGARLDTIIVTQDALSNNELDALISVSEPAPSEPTTVLVEVEDGSISSGFSIGTSSEASQGTYLEASTSGSGIRTAHAPFSVNAGTYNAWARLYGPSLSQDAIYVGIDGDLQRIYPSTIGSYEWVSLGSHTLSDDHDVSLGPAESGARIDLVVASPDALSTSELDALIDVSTTEPEPTPEPTPDSCDDCTAHEQLLDELVGFGQDTTGGKGGSLYTVTSLADSGSGTLRDALTRDEPLWIRFDVSGTIDLDSPISARSHKTVDGRGSDVTITGYGIYVTGEENVIINNMKFYRPSDDAIRIYNGARNVWVHHNDITADWEYPDAAVGDGAIDSTEDTTAITVSYNHIYDWDKTMLVGGSCDDVTECDGSGFEGTFHHNWYDNVRQRLPMLRHGWAHSYNNLFNWYGGYALDAHYQPAEIYSENDIFEPLSGVDHKVVAIASGTSVRIDGAYEKPYSTSLTLSEQNPSDVFDPSAYYSYAADPADASLESYIESNAGWQDVTWP